MTKPNADAGATERVHIVDDDEAMRDSLAWLLEARGFAVTAYASGEDFLAVLAAHPAETGDDLAGCLVLDVRMPGMSGLELYERLSERRITLPVIFVTGHGDVPMAVGALKKGAVDFIEKPFNHQEIVQLIEKCLSLDRSQRSRRHARADTARRLESLTERENEVLTLIVAGKMNKQIADELAISMKTVEVHRSRVMEKMGVRSLAELVQAVMGQRQDA